ncbi:MAG: hypothetical protein RL199_297 [Pseudomonadota bacterium]|jgi:hypothetical protein
MPTAAARKHASQPAVRSPSPASQSEPVTDAKLARTIDELESFINRAMAESGSQQERVADRVFAALYHGDVEAALSARTGSDPKYDALSARAGRSMNIDKGSLSRMLRVGALNHRLDDAQWSALPWSHKVELLPLLGTDLDFECLRKGVAFASKPDTWRSSLRDWVAHERAKGAPPKASSALTPLKAGKLLELGARLQRVAERRDLAERVDGLDDEARKAWMAALVMALRNLGKLHEEMTDTGDA